jgi:hypothetical protein
VIYCHTLVNVDLNQKNPFFQILFVAVLALAFVMMCLKGGP